MNAVMPFPPPVPVMAAGIDWLEGLLPVLFVLFWIVSQVWSLLRRVAGPPAAPPERRPQRPVAGPPREIGMDREIVDREIEEFLRRATGRAAEPTPAPPARPKAATPPVRPSQPDRPGRPPQPARAKQPPQPTVAAKDAATPPRGVEARPERQVGTLGGGETEVARHVHDVFSHELRHLSTALPDAAAGAGETPAPRRRPTAAEELAHLLRSPGSVRQVILLREVIDRPTHRW